MFASFVGLVVDEFTDSAHSASATTATQQLRVGFVFLSWLFLVCYTAFMATIIMLRSYNIGIQTFDTFKAFIALGELRVVSILRVL